MKKIIISLIVVAALLVGSVIAGRMEHVTKEIELGSAKSILVRGDFSSGEFRISPDDIELASVVDISYDSRRIDYDVDYSVNRSEGVLDLQSYNNNKNNIDTEDNKWDVILSTRYETEIDLEIGACDADFDFGGIPLTEINLEVGAASGQIDFSEPNPKRLDLINIDAGASSLEMFSIGNANFDEFEFSGGVGSFKLDFRGQYKGESTIKIELGLGSAEVILPKDIPVQIRIDGANWLSSVDFHNDDLDEIDDDLYESKDFEDAKTRIVIDMEVGLGAIDIYFR